MDTRDTVTIPADIDRPDSVLAGLNARQLAILIPAIAMVWLAYLTVGPIVAFPIFATITIPFLGTAAALALVERDGIPLHRLAWHAINHATRPHRLTVGEVRALPAWVHPSEQCLPLPAPLRLPAHAIRADGVINLGPEGVAVIVACSTVSFALRTPDEQAALVDGFGRWLNSLDGPTQILVQAQPINLTPTITALRERAATLPHPALEDAAADHARFLNGLTTTRDLFARHVLIVLKEPLNTGVSGQAGRRDQDTAAIQALRRAEQTVRTLAAAGINAQVLDGRSAYAAVAAAADPTAQPIDRRNQATPGEAVTGGTGAGAGAER